MRFRVHLVPQRYSHWLRDVAVCLHATLAELGYEADIGTPESGAVNVIVGGHSMRGQEIRDLPPGYVVYQSEAITEGGVNERPWGIYLQLLQNAGAVWDVLSENVPRLGALGIEASWLKPGYQQKLEEMETFRLEGRVDYTFYGSITKRRGAVLEKIGRGHTHRWVFDCSTADRMGLIERGRVFPIPYQSDTMRQLGWWRVLYLIHNRRVPVVEDCEQMDLGFEFPHAPSGEFSAACEAALDGTAMHGFELWDKLRQSPMAAHLAPLVEAL